MTGQVHVRIGSRAPAPLPLQHCLTFGLQQVLPSLLCMCNALGSLITDAMVPVQGEFVDASADRSILGQSPLPLPPLPIAACLVGQVLRTTKRHIHRRPPPADSYPPFETVTAHLSSGAANTEVAVERGEWYAGAADDADAAVEKLWLGAVGGDAAVASSGVARDAEGSDGEAFDSGTYVGSAGGWFGDDVDDASEADDDFQAVEQDGSASDSDADASGAASDTQAPARRIRARAAPLASVATADSDAESDSDFELDADEVASSRPLHTDTCAVATGIVWDSKTRRVLIQQRQPGKRYAGECIVCPVPIHYVCGF